MKSCKKAAIATVLGAVLMLFASQVGRAQEASGQERDPDVEAAIHDKLAAVDPEAVDYFIAATLNLDLGNLEEARSGYLVVLDLVPDSSDTLRRLSYIESDLGNYESAIEYAEKALAIEASPLNESALAMALLFGDDTPQIRTRSFNLAVDAAAEEPDDLYIQNVLLLTSIANDDPETASRAADRLIELEPEYPLAHFYAGLIAADDGDWIRAEEELELSRSLGMPDEMVDGALDEGISTQALLRKLINRFLLALALWLGLLILLFISGGILSLLSLRSLTDQKLGPEERISTGERLIRTVYRIIIVISSLYFYVSIPFLIVIVIAAVIGIGYLFISAGRVPVRLALFILIAGVTTLYAIVRSVFARVRLSDPGRPLPRNEAPKLWVALEEVAQVVGTRPVDQIFLSPGTEIGVSERGSIVKRLSDKSERFLVLGLGSLTDMSQNQFKGILAHEYGHFTHGDTSGGKLAYQVSKSIEQMAMTLAAAGQARWYNPAWIFINGYYRVFLRISLGASRLQEYLADRFAALAFGPDVLKAALIQIVHNTIVFSSTTNQEIIRSRSEGRPINNIYQLAPEDDLQDRIEQAIDQAMSRKTSPYDSHPSIADRIAALNSMSMIESSHLQDQPAEDLLPALEELQIQMTGQVQQNLNRLSQRI